MRKNCIVVPLYKQFSALGKTELLSLNQLYKVLGNHSIYLIGPASFNFSMYVNHARSNGVAINTKIFDDVYFSSINDYNRLMIADFFYKAFYNYRFILIYQTDSYVFRDELEEWCIKGYDYIGAPWSGIHVYDGELLGGVGNGGFSLRKVTGALKMLRKLRMLEVLEQYQHFNWKGVLPRLPAIIYKLLRSNRLPGKFEKAYNFQEDVFWCKSVGKRLKSFTCNTSLIKLIGRLLVKSDFKIAPVETAMQFSFETNPQALYKLNSEKLPFGCHAWEKYEPEFWSKFIDASMVSFNQTNA